MVARETLQTAAHAAESPLENHSPQTDTTTEKPRHQRPELPDFWDHRFRQGVTPWDAGRVPQQFATFSRAHRESLAGQRHTQRPRALVPGCGSAYEAGHLDALDWDTHALDFSAAAIDTARATLPEFGGQLHCADFFTFEADAPYDLIYERAFLCALPRHFWPDYAPRMARLLNPGGLLVGYFFLDETALKGPPFGMSVALLENFCKPWFDLLEDHPTPDGMGPFTGKERWMVWQKRSRSA